MLQRIIQRMTRIISLNTEVYHEIEHDPKATIEAALIVLVTSFMASLGAAIGSGRFIHAFLLRFVVGILLNWLLWSYATLLIGTRFFGGQAKFDGMLRTLGYANAPQVLGILSVFSCLGSLISLVTWALSLIAGFLAIRETLDLSTEKAILTVAIGWVVVLVVNILLWNVL
ncbi:MAG: hypothetical protein A2Y73_02770 [Chloroflexi bacterium RBG_13_56_8]|nr:MAG: hypothetical protein A2Y73_02770 [Chloroflexi bacterium RBG_13_56_8]